jgi:Sec-independent protein translocase protein TatA
MGMFLIIVFLALGKMGASTAAAQFGGFKDAARKAKEAMQKKKDAEEQARKEAEAKKEAEQKEAEAKEEAEAPKEAEGKNEKPPAEGAQQAPADAAPSFQVYSKFDFVPGEKIVAFEDFSQSAIGDFPAKWNTNGSGEVVTISGKPGRWLKLAANGFYTPEFITALPDDFTLELDILAPPTFKNGYPLQTVIAELPSPTGNSELLQWHGAPNVFQFLADPEAGGEVGSVQVILRQASVSTSANSRSTKYYYVK